MEIPHFAIFDGDMNGAKADNMALNKTIFSVIGYEGSGSDGSLSGHVFEKSFCVWKDSFQKAICEDVPNWMEDRASVCAEFGWTTDRLGKNPMVMEATLERAFKNGKIGHLETLVELITKRFIPTENALNGQVA